MVACEKCRSRDNCVKMLYMGPGEPCKFFVRSKSRVVLPKGHVSVWPSSDGMAVVTSYCGKKQASHLVGRESLGKLLIED